MGLREFTQEVVGWPARQSLRPVRHVGRLAYEFASSRQLAETRLAEDARDMRLRDLQTAIALAQAVSERLDDNRLSADKREAMEADFDEATQHIGRQVVTMAGEPEFLELLFRRLPPTPGSGEL